MRINNAAKKIYPTMNVGALKNSDGGAGAYKTDKARTTASKESTSIRIPIIRRHFRQFQMAVPINMRSRPMINMGSAITLNHCTFQREIEVLIEVSNENVPNKLEIPVERQNHAINRTRMLNDLRMAFFMSI